MDIKNRSMDSVNTFVSQSSSPGVGAMSEDQNSIKSEDLASVKVKLMCSHGGRIMPRPHDNQLRYVGGETRILVVSRNISFADLMSKLYRLCGKPVVVKYQLPNEDLDVLVSVLCDEDLDNMMEEFDRLECRDSTARLRLFLFPVKEQHAPEAIDDSRNAEQRFLDAVNGLCSVSKRQGSTVTSMPDFLFGLDGLATRERNPIVLPRVPSASRSVSQATFPIVDNVLDICSLPQVTPLPLDGASNENQLMKEQTDKTTLLSQTDKPALQSLETADSKQEPASETVPFSCISETNQTAPTYVPLVEIPRDQLPQGVVLRQFSVESSHQGSLDSLAPREVSNNNSLLGPSPLQIETRALSDSKDMELLSAIDEVDSNLSKASIEGTHSEGSMLSEERSGNEHKPEDEYPSFSTLTNPEIASDFTDKQITVEFHEESKVSLPVQDRMPAKQHIERYESSLQRLSGWQVSPEEQAALNVNVEALQEGEKAFKQPQQLSTKEAPVFMQRRASDPAVLLPHYQQNYPSNFISSSKFSAGAYWPGEDRSQLYYEGVKILPQPPGLVLKPGLVQGATESVVRVTAASTAVRMSDTFASNYPVPPSYSSQLQRQYPPNVIYPDQLPVLPQHQVKGVTFRDQAAAQSLQGAQLSSRLREQRSLGFQEHVVAVEERLARPVQQSFRQQFAYHADPVEHGNAVMYDPSLPQVHYIETLSKAPQYKAINQMEDPSMPLHDAGLLPLQEVLSEAQINHAEGWQHSSQSLMRS